MKYIAYFLLIPALYFSQSKTYPVRQKGEVFKSRPEKPYENLRFSGEVVVEKGAYGLRFIDRRLSATTKQKVEQFFSRRYQGYTELKTYTL